MSVSGSGPVPLGTGGVRPVPVPRTRGALDRARLSGLWIRRALGFGVALIGMLWIGAEYVDTSWCWFLWIGVGLLAGVVVGRGRDVWLVLVAGVVFFPVAAWQGLPVVPTGPPEAWYVASAIGALLASSGFIVGSLVWTIPRLRDAIPAVTDVRPAGKGLVLAAIGVAVLVIAGWVSYAGMVGGAYLTQPAATLKWQGCDTPGSRFNAAYEAINYDPADDARLLAANPDAYSLCSSRGSPAGTEVVSKDGTGIAGWYIPAANGMGATGPTFVVAPGWKSNKSEILKYVPALHEAYNLVLIDLRNGGRSQGNETTWGYDERDDVHAIIDWLVRTKHPGWIGATGNSMGAATVLAEAAGDQRVRALILDSMHATIVASFGDGIEVESHLPGYPTTYAAVLAASAKTRHDLPSVDPVRTITQLGDRPVLLLHGAADPLDRPEHSAELNLAAATAAGVPVELHYCPGAGHGKVVDTCPAQWAAWAKAFLDPIVPTSYR